MIRQIIKAITIRGFFGNNSKFPIGNYPFSTNKFHKPHKNALKQSSKQEKSPKHQSKSSFSSNFQVKKSKFDNKQKLSKKIVQEQPQVEIDPKIAEFNNEIKAFIQMNTQPILGPSLNNQAPIMIQPKITTQLLSNLYRLIIIKGQFLGLNIRQGLSRENKTKIQGLLKTKSNQSHLFTKRSEPQELQFNWSLRKHEEICETVYLSAMIGEKRIHANIKADFLQYLSNLPFQIKTPQNSSVLATFLFLQTETTNKTSSETLALPILVPKLFPSHTFLTNPDNIAFEIIKAMTEKRSTAQMIDSMKALTKLLTIKQLRTMDNLLVQGVLETTKKQVEKVISVNDLTLRSKSPDTKIMALDQIIRLSSILSQLSINGQSIKKCQSIFMNFLHIQTKEFSQLYNDLQKSMESVSFLPSLKFDQIMKIYIAIGQLGAFDRDFIYLMEKYFILKLKITSNIENQIENDGNITETLRSLRSKYAISEKQVSILLSTLHKFKKGNEVILLKQKKAQTEEKTLNQTPYQNIWLTIYEFYTSFTRKVPEPFLFSVLSGLYRAYSPLIMNAIYDNKIRNKTSRQEVEKVSQTLNETFGTVIRKLYEADEELTYLKELKMQKLIEFVIVCQMAFMIGTLRNIKGLKTNTQFYPIVIQKILEHLQAIKSQKPQDVKSQQPEDLQMPSFQGVTESKRERKQKQQIYFLLQFFLVYVKAKFEVLNALKKQDNKKKIEESVEKVKAKLRKVNMKDEMMILVSGLVGIEKFFGENLVGKDRQKGLKVLQVANSLQSFVGFSSMESINEYTAQLHENLLTSLFPQILDEQEILDSLSKRLLRVQGQNDPFVCEKVLVNNMIFMEEMVRIKLIRDEEEFKQYENLGNSKENENEAD